MKKQILIFSLFITGLAVYCIPIIWYTIPGTDGGVFMYIGKRMLDGAVPYRDIFDHKGTLLYFINALGIFISGGDIWGVRIVEILFMIISVLICYYCLRSIFSLTSAVFASAAWLISLPVVMANGNYCEEYSILFQFLGLLAFLFFLEKNLKRYLFFLGLSLSAAFLLRPNLIGFHGAILIYLLYLFVMEKRLSDLMAVFAYITAGFLCLALPVLFYFYIHESLADLWDQLFVFNSAYSSGSWRIRLNNLVSLFFYNLRYGMPVIAISGWIAGFTIYRKTENRNIKAVAFVALAAFPLSVAMILLSLRSDINYYISFLPAYALLSGFLAYYILSVWGKRMVYGLAFIILLTGVIPFRSWVGLVNQNIIRNRHPLSQIKDYIRNNTEDGETVLMWGSEARINLVANRESPTKYIYQWPLYRVGYVNDSHVERFLNDIRENKPVLIIDTKNGNFASLDSVRRKQWLSNYRSPYHQMPENMNKVIQYIHGHYSRVDTTLSPDWDIYRRNESY